jgi:UDP-N-acetylmuramate--alanine ligase
VHFIPDLENIVEFLKNFAKPGDIIITCGAGNIYTVGQKLSKELPEHRSRILAAG